MLKRPLPSPSSVIAWRGPSMFTGDWIQVVLTGLERPSQNEKTRPMTQIWIVRTDGNPSVDLGTEREQAVCGDCPLCGRGRRRICYVAYGIWRLAAHLERYPYVGLEEAERLTTGKALRLGAYGDPAAVPIGVWDRLLSRASSWTGYTHAWRTCNSDFRHFCMASCEDALSTLRAQAHGWRTFRVKHPAGELLQSEIMCPSEVTTCLRCRLCSGTARRARNIAINVHGSGAAHFLRIVQRDLFQEGVR
jgi:hypothetical protein